MATARALEKACIFGGVAMTMGQPASLTRGSRGEQGSKVIHMHKTRFKRCFLAYTDHSIYTWSAFAHVELHM